MVTSEPVQYFQFDSKGNMYVFEPGLDSVVMLLKYILVMIWNLIVLHLQMLQVNK